MARVIVLATFAPPPAPEPDPWPGIYQELVGSGQRFALQGPGALARLRPGTKGYTFPPITRWAGTSPEVAGSWYLGHVEEERPVFWPILLWGGLTSQEWMDLEAKFFDVLLPHRTAEWRVTQPSGETRSLTVRLVSDGDPAWDHLPGSLNWASYGLGLVAEDPFWKGTTQTVTWANADAQKEFIDPDPAIALWISDTLQDNKAVIDNPGDVESAPVWWLHGPTTGPAEFTTEGKTIRVPFTVPAGQTLVMDADPRVRRAIQVPSPPDLKAPLAQQQALVAAALPAGVDRTTELDESTRWGLLAPGKNREVGVEVPGISARVRVTVVPRHYRAWGVAGNAPA